VETIVQPLDNIRTDGKENLTVARVRIHHASGPTLGVGRAGILKPPCVKNSRHEEVSGALNHQQGRSQWMRSLAVIPNRPVVGPGGSP
jgi:hypothetical protein